MKTSAWVAVCGLGLAMTAGLSLRVSSAQEELDPLKVAADTHRLLFENQFVRVIGAQVPPGAVEPKHRHMRGVTVHLADYDVEQKTFPDGKTSRGHRSFGAVTWSEAGVHEVKNVGTTPSHAIRVELKM